MRAGGAFFSQPATSTGEKMGPIIALFVIFASIIAHCKKLFIKIESLVVNCIELFISDLLALNGFCYLVTGYR